MTLPSRRTLALNAGCLGVLAWLYGGDLADALRARSADVSAFLVPPPRVWPAVVLVVSLGVLGVVGWGLVRGRGEDFKGYRLPPIVLVLALFFDLVLAEGQMPLRSEDVVLLSLEQFELKARELARGGRVPRTPEALRPVVEAMGQPPYLLRGVRAPYWSLQVREGCTGPVTEAPGLQVGTFVYCLAADGSRAWVTLVVLPPGRRFGVPEVLRTEGRPAYALVEPEAPEGEAMPPGPGQLGPGAPGWGATPGGPDAPDARERVPGPTP